MSILHRRHGPRANVLVTALFIASNLLAQSCKSEEAPSKVPVAILVTLDGSPCPNAKVDIKPRKFVADWPEGKSRITVTTDAHGLASLQLGAGDYIAIAHDPYRTRLPAEGWFPVKPGKRQPQKIHLNLLYWDCSKVTCLL